MGDASGSSNIVENAHGHGAQQMKHHWMFCERSLQARGMITSIAAAFRPAPEAVQLNKAVDKVDRLELGFSRSRYGARQQCLHEISQQDRDA